MKSPIKHLGILTSGGDAPGLNAVIRGAVKTAILHYNLKVTGIKDGFEGLLYKDGFIPLTLKDVRGILPRGGTILGTSNTGKYGAFFEKTSEAVRKKLLKDGIASLKKNRIDALLAIGGEGSLLVASKFFDAGFPVVGIPKTIDNDLFATDYTFGYDTAVHIATEALDRLTTTAESHHRVMILEVMGRNAGWIALGAGVSGGADIILIPEIPFSIEKIVRHIKLRRSTGARSHIIVVAEGAVPLGGGMIYVKTSKGKRRLGGIAAWLTNELGKRIENEIRYTVLGHIQRGGTPTSFDRSLASRFGASAVDVAVRGEFGKMVCLRTPHILTVPIAEAINNYKTIDPQGDEIMTARRLGLGFGD